MDKQNNGNTIKIKINGNDNPIKEGNKGIPPDGQKKGNEKGDKQPAKPMEHESAATRESSEEDDTFDWILPSGNHLPKKDESKVIHLHDRKKEKLPIPFKSLLNHKTKNDKVKSAKAKTKSFKKMNVTMLLSVIFAIILGTVFGLILLKLVPTDQAVGGEEDSPVIAEQTTEQTTEQPKPNGSIDVTLPPLTTAVVQEGIYSSQSIAEDNLSSLKEKGTPAAILPIDGKYAIFISMADTVADAKIISKNIDGNGETFSKEFTIGEKKISLQHEEEKKLLELSPQLFKILTASATTAGVSNNISEAAMKNIEKETAVLSQIDKEKLENKAVLDMYSQLEAAAAQLKLYEKNPEDSTFLKLQQSLLSFMAAYISL
ncbi:hypothetical protein [Niallia endozanthoxylica]|uniref:SPOR domain-containing protein n=1 Tax=Niallia endozanthoxylica TaxID=2036016 RepID=A0A5J5HNT8_9BACI|nr:hypothetical protein [Niallia endozanthoxylica]KAA9023131.1 hypothetical protein F4V44_13600 [Niallia endozanthoxylica]